MAQPAGGSRGSMVRSTDPQDRHHWGWEFMESPNVVVETILSRRSIRSGYRREAPVPIEILRVVTECGLSAPSSKNARPWRFHVVTETDTLDAIAEAVECVPGIDNYVPHDPATGRPHPHWSSTVLESAAVLRMVPAAIFIENRGVFSGGRATLRAAPAPALAGALASYAFECAGIGAALENMWLAALSLGLAASFIGDIAAAEDYIAQSLGLGGDLVGVLALGYSDSAALPALESPGVTQVAEPVVWHPTPQRIS